MLTRQSLAAFSALLIALFVSDFIVPLIDLFSIPVPRYVFGFSGTAVFGLAALLLLWPAAKAQGVALLTQMEFGFLGILALWGGQELLLGLSAQSPTFSFVLSFLPAFCVAVLTRLHLDIFTAPALLIEAFIKVMLGYGLVHLSLLLLAKMGAADKFVNILELSDKNTLSALLALCLWLFGRLSPAPKFSAPLFRLLFLLTTAHIFLNHARAASLVFLASFVLLGIRRTKLRPSALWPCFLAASILVGILTIFSFSLLTLTVPTSLGAEGDAQISTFSRSLSNYKLFQQLMDSPLLGVGWQTILETRAFGYISHTLYLIILSAYGLVGAIPLGLLVLKSRLFQNAPSRPLLFEAIFLITLMGSFFNDPLPVYGFLLALLPWVTKIDTNGPRPCLT